MDDPHARWIPSSNYFPGRAGYSLRWLIIHGMAGFGSAEEVGYYFQQAETEFPDAGRIARAVLQAITQWTPYIVASVQARIHGMTCLHFWRMK
jgi:hypothetical protein